MVFHLSWSDSKSLQVFGSLLSNLVDLINTVVWMVATCPLISTSSSPFIKPYGIVPSATITIGMTLTFKFPRFLLKLLWQRLRTYFSFHFLSFLFLRPPVQQSSLFGRFSFFIFFIYYLFFETISRLGRLPKIKCPVCIFKFRRNLHLTRYVCLSTPA